MEACPNVSEFMPEPGVILLVEDNEDDVFLMTRAWEETREKHRLVVVGNGEEAVAYLRGLEPFADRAQYPLPTLLLLDLRMPLRNGFELLQWVRAQPGLRRLRIIVLTTSWDPRDVMQAYDLGANSFLVKPPGFQATVDIIKGIQNYWLKMDQVPQLTPPAASQWQPKPADGAGLQPTL
jgi:CheY-like chemotaxis protein